MKAREKVVIKLGGSALKNRECMKMLLGDVARISQACDVVIVHGGGPEINAALTAADKQPRFLEGLRITDSEVLSVVRDVLDKMNGDIVQHLQEIGVNGISVQSDNHCLSASKKWVFAPTGAKHDIGWVGKIDAVDCNVVTEAWAKGGIPVFVSLGHDEQGNLYNVNADEAAMALAIALAATTLVFVTDVPGVMLNDETIVPELGLDDISLYIESGIITGGMIPKVRSCANGVRQGVGRVLITKPEQPGDLEKAVMHAGSKGTAISKTACYSHAA
ncbi:MAG TPA: acetylglutamate kinase [Candidatus Obscuribacterales bacterium]